MQMAQSLHAFKSKLLDGTEVDLASYKGKVLLIVNVASHCGFTPQYEDLEKIYQQYASRGFVVLAFPCNQFGGQEPGEAAEIANFCATRYQVTFPIFSKIDVNGKNQDPLYAFLKSSAKGFLGTENIKWNFTKFLIGKNGQVIKRFGSMTSPLKLMAEIEKALKVQ